MKLSRRIKAPRNIGLSLPWMAPDILQGKGHDENAAHLTTYHVIVLYNLPTQSLSNRVLYFKVFD